MSRWEKGRRTEKGKPEIRFTFPAAMAEDGHLSWESFHVECHQLLTNNRTPCLWGWEESPEARWRTAQGFLRTVAPWVVVSRSTGDLVEGEDEKENEEDEKDEEAVGLPAPPTLFHLYHYHIVYSPTYRVPVLYVHATRTDGALVPWECVLSDLVSRPFWSSEEEKRTFLTPGEHPVLGTPSYYVHPCHTAEAMRSTLCAVKEAHEISLPVPVYLNVWLGLIGELLPPRNRT